MGAGLTSDGAVASFGLANPAADCPIGPSMLVLPQGWQSDGGIMMFRAFVAAIAVVAIPIAVNGAEPTAKARDDSNRRICVVHGTTGSRVNDVRVCRTRAEWDAAKIEARDIVDRVQNHRAIICSPQPGC